MKLTTPTPWSIDALGYIRGADNQNILEKPENAYLICKTVNCFDKLIEALKEISEGKGRYSLDQFEHCRNTVEDMKELAKDALKLIEEA